MAQMLLTPFRELARLLFYVEPPSSFSHYNVDTKSSHDTISQVPSYIVMAMPYFIGLAVVEMAIGRLRGAKRLYRVNDTVASINLGLFQQLTVLWYDFFWVIVHCWVYDKFRLVTLAPDSTITWIGLFLFVDMAYYWFHRFAHTYHFMWAGHSLHHSGEDYNLTTALRQGAFQSITASAFYIPLALFFPPACYVAHKRLNTLFQFWIHTSVIGRLGPLEYIFNTASHHRMHHRPPGNCNYAGVLIIWDRMFGTFVPEDKHLDYYGLALQYTTFDPVWANLEHPRRLWDSLVANKNSSPSLGEFIMAFLRKRVVHPWKFEPLELIKPIPPLENNASSWTIPSVSKRVKYDGQDKSSHNQTLTAYIMFIFAINLITGIWVEIFSKKMTRQVYAMYFFYTSLALSANGRLSDSIYSGRALETARLLLLLALPFMKFMDPLPLPAHVITTIAIVQIVVWAVCYSKVSSEMKQLDGAETKKAD